MNRLYTALLLVVFTVTACGSLPKDVGAERRLQLSHSVVRLKGDSGAGGTGFSVRSPSGEVYTMTNSHVCALANSDGLLHADSPLWEGARSIKVMSVSKTADLCLLEPIHELTPVLAAQSLDTARRLYAYGHPRLSGQTLSEGFVVERKDIDLADEDTPLDQCNGPGRRVEVVQNFIFAAPMCIVKRDAWLTSLVIHPGSSGSPVVNDAGNLVGVMFAGMSDTGYGAMVPVERVLEFFTEALMLANGA